MGSVLTRSAPAAALYSSRSQPSQAERSRECYCDDRLLEAVTGLVLRGEAQRYDRQHTTLPAPQQSFTPIGEEEEQVDE